MTRQEAKSLLYSRYAETMGNNPERLDDIVRVHGRDFDHLLPSKKDTPILDIGCGDGCFLLYLLRRGFSALHGVDTSPDQVAAAHAAGLAQVEQGMALGYLSKCEARFGVVSAQNILEHLTLEETLELLQAIHRSLTKGGELWIVVPNALSPLGIVTRYSDLTHEICYTPKSMIQALTVCGFENVRVMEYGTPLVHGVKSLVRSLAWKAIRAQLHFRRLVAYGEAGPAAVYSHDMLIVARKADRSSTPAMKR